MITVDRMPDFQGFTLILLLTYLLRLVVGGFSCLSSLPFSFFCLLKKGLWCVSCSFDKEHPVDHMPEISYLGLCQHRVTSYKFGFFDCRGDWINISYNLMAFTTLTLHPCCVRWFGVDVVLCTVLMFSVIGHVMFALQLEATGCVCVFLFRYLSSFFPLPAASAVCRRVQCMNDSAFFESEHMSLAWVCHHLFTSQTARYVKLVELNGAKKDPDYHS